MSKRFANRLGHYIDTPPKAAAVIIVAVAAVQLAGAPHAGLGVDEAHYALYGRFPALSYFDHPPLVGWLQWAMLRVGDSEFVLRILPIAMLAFSAWSLYGLAVELYAERSPWLPVLAVAAMQTGLMFHLIGFGMLPDGPLLLFGLLAMRQLARIARGGGGMTWLVLGLLLGLAALSKYTAVTLVFSAALVLLVFRRWGELGRFWIWLGVVIALLLCIPIVTWNMQNDWISIQYQLQHGTGKKSWSIGAFLATQAGQFAAYSPGHYLFGWFAVAVALRHWPRVASGDRLSLIFGLPILVLFGLSGGYVRGLPHWPALGWAALMPMTVCFIADRWQRSRAIRIGTRLTLLYSIAGLVLLHALAHLPLNPAPPYMHPLDDLMGWDAAASRAVLLRQQMDAEYPDAEAVVFVRRWTQASRVGWYSWPEPIKVLSGRNMQFHIWYGAPVEGQNGILVLYENKERPPEKALGRVEDWFDTAIPIDSLKISKGGKPVGVFHFYRCFGLRPVRKVFAHAR